VGFTTPEKLGYRFISKLFSGFISRRGGFAGAVAADVLPHGHQSFEARGQAAVLYVQRRAEEVLHNFSIIEIEKFDQELIAANLSPGGSADCLAITLFLSAFVRGRFLQK
jgi:hypothetical protein